MTDNQINYAKHLEDVRHNYEQEDIGRSQVLANRYGSELAAQATMYGADTAAAASRFSSMMSNEASHYASDTNRYINSPENRGAVKGSERTWGSIFFSGGKVVGPLAEGAKNFMSAWAKETTERKANSDRKQAQSYVTRANTARARMDKAEYGSHAYNKARNEFYLYSRKAREYYNDASSGYTKLGKFNQRVNAPYVK